MAAEGKWHRVCLNTIVRKGVKLDSERMRILPMGSRVRVVETVERRVRIDQPIQGWCSLRSSNGDTILTPLEDTDNSQSNEVTPRTASNMQPDYLQKQKLVQEQVNKMSAAANNIETQLASKLESNPELKGLLNQMQSLKEQVQNDRSKYSQLEQVQNQLQEACSKAGLSDPQELLQNLKNKNDALRNAQNELKHVSECAAVYQKELEELRTLFANSEANQSTNKATDKSASYRPGDVVICPGLGMAIVRYCGPVEGADSSDGKKGAEYLGLELEGPVGDTNGTFNDTQYFNVKENHGQFWPVDQVSRQVTAAEMLKKLSALVSKEVSNRTARD